jgi:hypothetical protein
MKTLLRSFALATVLVAVLVGTSAPAWAQASLSSTTTSAAITSTSTTTVQLTSTSGVTANNTFLLIDRELMAVNSVSGTTVYVQRGASGTRATLHTTAATAYFGSPTYFTDYYRAGACTRSDQLVLPLIWAAGNTIYECSGSPSVWTSQPITPVYLMTLVGFRPPAAASPSAGGAGLTATGGVGGAQSATTGNGAAGGGPTVTGGVGGAGGSSSGTGGTGGAVGLTGGAGGGTITGGTGGAVNLTAGSGGAGSSAGGSGGIVLLRAGAAGSGGTGAAGKVTIADATDSTKRVNFDVSGITTATTRTITVPDASITLNGIAVTNCLTGGATCSGSTVSSTAKIVYGLSGALNGASPSVAAVTLGVTFTSSSTYTCTANPVGTTAAVAAGGIAVSYTSSSVVTFTSANGATATVAYVCIGT